MFPAMIALPTETFQMKSGSAFYQSTYLCDLFTVGDEY